MMEGQEHLSRPSTAATPAFEDDELMADNDEPPDHHTTSGAQASPFCKSMVRPAIDRGQSLLTQALMSTPRVESDKLNMKISTDLARRRSTISIASLASTAELTSDGGWTSPARTTTPSPPPPPSNFTSFAPFTAPGKVVHALEPVIAKPDCKGAAELPEVTSADPQVTRPVEEPPKKRCISFACDGKKGTAPAKSTLATTPMPAPQTVAGAPDVPKRKCTIKFACPGPQPPHRTPAVDQGRSAEVVQKSNSNTSPTPTKTSLGAAVWPSPRPHRDSTSTVRRRSRSPVAVRAKAKYITADEKVLRSSDAHFHEFASESWQDDDWIADPSDLNKEKLTIDDTLKKENAIRRLASEAEEEALMEEEDDDEEDDDEQDGSLSEGQTDFEDDADEDEDEDADGVEDDGVAVEVIEGSDGNETDNEAGFADSDDESDAEGDFAFWRPGRGLVKIQSGEPSTYRPSAHRTASTSSIDSLHHMSPARRDLLSSKPRRRPIIIRPGTPELPDSTDFVCGTLDEDRPIEDAYVSCMEARKFAKHKCIPQDIDPSFPTSDIDAEEPEDDIIEGAQDSDEHIWLHGKFEEDDDRPRRRSAAVHLSPRRLHSPPPPRRLHSPPPIKHRLRSPPPRKLFGGYSFKSGRSPPLNRSPPASPITNGPSNAIPFIALGSRPGLTHTKSLPRTPNTFCRRYTASRLAAANGNPQSSDETDLHIRGAIDIQKGLENKRQRRNEKMLRKKQEKPERKPQPGRGAERMKELGLLMAGKTGPNNPYMLSA